MTRQHRFLLRRHMDQIDALDAAIARSTKRWKVALHPFAPPSNT